MNSSRTEHQELVVPSRQMLTIGGHGGGVIFCPDDVDLSVGRVLSLRDDDGGPALRGVVTQIRRGETPGLERGWMALSVDVPGVVEADLEDPVGAHPADSWLPTLTDNPALLRAARDGWTIACLQVSREAVAIVAGVPLVGKAMARAVEDAVLKFVVPKSTREQS